MRYGKIFILLFLVLFFAQIAQSKKRTIKEFFARPPIHIKNNSNTPIGLTPEKIKAVYHLPDSGGNGTVAIIDAYDAPTIENDLSIFSKQFHLSTCTIKNGCLEIHKMISGLKKDNGWAGETALDVEWVHAIAPKAKILLVEATSASGENLLKAVDFARNRQDVVAVSMSWGGAEFEAMNKLDNYFVSIYGATFFASSGDNGTGVQWPAVSMNVIGVGGTTLNFNNDGSFKSETAWEGSGGGVSSYVSEPIFQTAYRILKLNRKRAVPDVSYNANPSSGFSVYQNGRWLMVGGTSAGAPQWAALRALGKNITISKLYEDASGPDYASYFRDILKGINGDCKTFCNAKKNYDTVTGLGSPLTYHY